MKPLRLFSTILLLVVLAAGMSVAQENKTVQTYSATIQGLLPCADDYIVGEESIVQTNWDNKVQLRCKGTFTGVSGKMYTWSLVENYSRKDFTEGAANNGTLVVTSVIECEGVPIAIYKIRIHFTINANGEPTVEFERVTDGYICL